MQKIVPQLWFDTEAKEAAELYVSLFENSKITNVVTLHDTPSGDAETVTFELAEQEFGAISAGPYFKFNPSISFAVACDSKEEVEKLHDTLIKGGSALMELGEYPFSEKYAWIQDKYGLSWQIMFTKEKIKQKITPTLMFVGEVCGKTKEAITFYTSLFKNSAIDHVLTYGEGREPEAADSIMHAGFTLAGQEFAAMDSALKHEFMFNEAVSLLVKCEDQAEIDYFWDKLSAVPEAEQCGWLKDKYGVSWQIAPKDMDELMATKDSEKLARVTQAFLKMKKFNIAELRKAAEG